MLAAAFLAEFNARFACSLRLLADQEWDQTGRQVALGTGCESCTGCETRQGEMGATEFCALERRHGVLKLRWACPKCGVSVYEDTDALSALANAKAISIDPLCHRCRSIGKESA